VINVFLDARRLRYSVAGGDRPLTERTVKDYAAGLTYMFAVSRLRGTKGVRVVPECIRPSSPWHENVKLEIEREAETVRVDPGAFIGKPMATEDINNLKAAAKKDARRNGQHPATSRKASPDTLHKLYTALLVNQVGGSAPVTAPRRVATDAVLSDGEANCPPPPENLTKLALMGIDGSWETLRQKRAR